MKPVAATFPSMIALVATVVACTTRPTWPGATPASPRIRRTAAMNPIDGSPGVVETLAIRSAPLASSSSVASVNVPPMSTPSL
jgi:hypothetical protein